MIKYLGDAKELLRLPALVHIEVASTTYILL